MPPLDDAQKTLGSSAVLRMPITSVMSLHDLGRAIALVDEPAEAAQTQDIVDAAEAIRRFRCPRCGVAPAQRCTGSTTHKRRIDRLGLTYSRPRAVFGGVVVSEPWLR